MSEQSLDDSQSEARPPRCSLAARLSRHRPAGTTWVTLASMIAFAIIATG